MTTRRGPRRQGVVLGVACALLAVLVPAQAQGQGVAPTCEVQGGTIRIDPEAFNSRVHLTRDRVTVIDEQEDLEASCSIDRSFSRLEIDQQGSSPAGSVIVFSEVSLGSGFAQPVVAEITSFKDVFWYHGERGPVHDVVGESEFFGDVRIDMAGGTSGVPDVVVTNMGPGTLSLGRSDDTSIGDPVVLDLGGSGVTGQPFGRTARLFGGPGADTLKGGSAADLLYGRGGDDTIHTDDPPEDPLDFVDCGAGNDTGAGDPHDDLIDCEFGVPEVELSPARGTVEEGAQAIVKVSIDRPTPEPFDVKVRTHHSRPDLSASAFDYQKVEQVLTFAPGGPLSFDIAVDIVADQEAEPEEDLAVIADGPGPKRNGEAQVAIAANAAPPPPLIVTARDATAVEGDPAQVEVVLSRPAGSTVEGDLAAGDGPPARIVFAPGTTSVVVELPTEENAVFDGDRELPLVLRNLSSGQVGQSGKLTLRDDEAAPVVRCEDNNVKESATERFLVCFLRPASSVPVTRQLGVEAGTAAAGDIQIAGSVTFPAGSTQAPVPYTVPIDGLDEPEEKLRIVPDGAQDTPGTITIQDGDPTPTASVKPAAGTEGQVVEVGLTTDVASHEPQSIDVTTAGLAAPVRATFPARERTTSVQLTIPDDKAYQGGTRKQAVTLANPTSGLVAGEPGELTITDDETSPPVVVSSTSVGEGGEAAVELTLGEAVGTSITRKVTTEEGTAEVADFEVVEGREVTFAAGTTKATVTVKTKPDEVFEGDETLSLKTDAAGDTPGTVTITDDEQAPTLRATDTTATEGTQAAVTVELGGTTARPVEATLSAGGTAVPVRLEPGTTSTIVPLPVADNATYDGPRELPLAVSGVKGATAGVAATLAVVDDEQAPKVNAGSAAGEEGDTVPVRLVLQGPASSRELRIDVSSAGVAPVTATFAPGTRESAVDLVLPDDEVFQGADRVQDLALSKPVGGVVPGTAGKLTVRDDETAPTVTIADDTVVEGETKDVTLTLSGEAAQDVVRQVSATPGTASAGDFAPIAAQDVTFEAGETTATLPVAAVEDAAAEPAETFTLVASGPGGTPGTITITDDDPQPVLTAKDATTTEGDPAEVELELSAVSGGAVEATVNGVATTIEAGETTGTVSVPVAGDEIDNGDRSTPLEVVVTKGLAKAGKPATLKILDDDDAPVVNAGDGKGTEGGTADVDVALTRASSRDLTVEVGTDGVTPVTAAFKAGDTTTTVKLPVPADGVHQGADRRQPITLSGLSDGVTKGEAGQLTIVDDEAVPTVTVKGTSVDEGGTAEVQLVLSPKAATDVTRTVATKAGTAEAADFTAIAAQPVTFKAGETSAKVGVAAAADEVDEPAETFSVAASGPDDTPGTVTIQDKNATPVLTAKDAETVEGRDAEVEVVLSGASSRVVTAQLNGRPVELAAGALTTELKVPAAENGTYDGERRQVPLALTGVSEGAEAGEDGTLTVLDNESAPTVAIDDATVEEGTSVDLQLTLSGEASIPVSRKLALDPAIEDVSLADEVTFAPGQVTKAVALAAKADGTDEPEETVRVRPDGERDTAGTVTVEDRDATPSVAAADAEGTEGGTAEVGLTLSGPSSRELSVDVGTRGTDAVRATFEAGTTTTTAALPVPDDEVFQGDQRTQPITLAELSDDLTAGEAGALTIADDEAAPAAAVRDAEVGEGEEAQVTIELARAASAEVVRTVSTRTGTAGAGDFAGIDARTVTFPAGTTTRTVTVRAEQDQADEPDETFSLVLAGAPEGVTDTTGTVTITDDDAAPAAGTAGSSTSGRPAPGTPKVVDSGAGLPVVCVPFEIALLDARRVGRQVLVTGYALPRFAGRSVALTADGKPAGTATVARSGLFQLRTKVAQRYGAKVGGAVARNLRLERRLQITALKGSGSRVEIGGRLALPARQRPTSLVLSRQDASCADVTVGKVRLDRRGRFTVKLDRPAPGQVLRVYRLLARTKGGRVYSVPLVVLP